MADGHMAKYGQIFWHLLACFGPFLECKNAQNWNGLPGIVYGSINLNFFGGAPKTYLQLPSERRGWNPIFFGPGYWVSLKVIPESEWVSDSFRCDAIASQSFANMFTSYLTVKLAGLQVSQNDHHLQKPASSPAFNDPQTWVVAGFVLPFSPTSRQLLFPLLSSHLLSHPF